MDKKNTNPGKAALTFGIIGLAAGITLILTGNKFIGTFGAIVCIGLTYKGYVDLKKAKK